MRSITLGIIFIISTAIATDIPHGYVIIKNPKSTLVVTEAIGNVIVDHYKKGDDTQLWKFEATIKGHFIIINKKSGKALEKDSKEIFIVTSPVSECKSQQWFVNSDETIANVASGLYLDIKGAVFQSGTPLIAWEKKGDANQKFILEVV